MQVEMLQGQVCGFGAHGRGLDGRVIRIYHRWYLKLFIR